MSRGKRAQEWHLHRQDQPLDGWGGGWAANWVCYLPGRNKIDGVIEIVLIQLWAKYEQIQQLGNIFISKCNPVVGSVQVKTTQHLKKKQ